MERGTWTYEVPPAAADAAGLEDYAVETVEGDSVGKVKVVVQRGDDLLVVVESGMPPLRSELRAVPWSDLAEVDHDAVLVRVTADALARAQTLDPALATEGEEADAIRTTAVPAAPPTRTVRAEAGPVDRPTYLVAVFLLAIGLLGLLIVIAAGSLTSLGWWWAFAALPVALIALGGVFAYEFFRSPSDSA